MSGQARALVGRDRELQALADLLDRAAAGRGTVALVSGEPGIGKTRLLEEVADQAAARGFAVAWGRAWEMGNAPSYWPWIEAMRTLMARPGGRDAAAEAAARLLPELGGRAASSQHADSFQLFDVVAGALQAAAEREPLLLVLDDLHAADPSSLQLAEFVARALRGSRVALFASHRDLEARRSPPIEASLSRLARAGHSFLLERLGVADVASLVREAIGHEDTEAARMIRDATEGNPLFVQELLRLLAARGVAGGGVPAGVRTVIRERLAMLSPATVALLQAAALVGREWPLRVAAEVAGVTPSALEDAAAEAKGAEILIEAGPGRLRFSHALVAETLAADLAEPVRAKLHARAAETLERVHADDPAAPLDEIARHWLAAGDAAAPRALAAAVRAAEAATARFAFADAALLHGRALEVLALVAPGDARQRAELLLRQCEAHARAGDRAGAQAACQAAAELARGLGDPELLARAALAFGAEVAVARVEPAMIALLERALESQPPGDGPWRARLMGRLAAARQPDIDPRPPMELAREAIAMARRIGDAQVLLEVIHAAMGALMDYALAEERAPLNAEVARLAAVAGDLPRRLRALARLAFDRVELADVAGFERAVVEYEEVAAGTHQPRAMWMSPMFRSMCAAWQGRLVEAARLADSARAMCERNRDPAGVPIFEMRQVMLAMLQSDPTPAEAMLRAATGRPIDEGNRVYIKMQADIHSGRIAAASEGLAFFETMGASLTDPHMVEMAAEVTWRARDTRRAEVIYVALEARAGRPFLVTGIGFLVTGLVDQALLRMAIVLRRWDDADRHAQHALDVCARLGARFFAPGVQFDWAVSLIERGGEGELERAGELVAAARAGAEEVGLGALVRECDALASRLAGRPMPVATAPAPRVGAPASEIRLAREGEYWVAEGDGESCRIRDSRGVQMLATLLANPGRELHVLELSGASEAVDGGDAGEVIDREARAAYVERLDELRAEIEEATAWNDAGRRARLEEEAAALREELSAAYGLGGRERRTGSAAERARTNVRRRLADALRRIEEACPNLGRRVRRSIKTGVYCVYEPL